MINQYDYEHAQERIRQLHEENRRCIERRGELGVLRERSGLVCIIRGLLRRLAFWRRTQVQSGQAPLATEARAPQR